MSISLKPCPLCGSAPILVKSEQDRGLHPAAPKLRYSCTKDGHIVASEWVMGASLTTNHDSPDLIRHAQVCWNERHQDKKQEFLAEFLTSEMNKLEKEIVACSSIADITYLLNRRDDFKQILSLLEIPMKREEDGLPSS